MVTENSEQTSKEPPRVKCYDCGRTFSITFFGDTALHSAVVRFCPRCGSIV